MKKQACKLDEWRVAGKFLIGKVFGHPVIKDGTLVTTGKLIGFDPKNKTAETLNTHYELGKAV